MGGTVLPTPHYVELRYPDGKLAARYDPVRGILELRQRGATVYFDLAMLANEVVEAPEETCYNFNG